MSTTKGNRGAGRASTAQDNPPQSPLSSESYQSGAGSTRPLTDCTSQRTPPKNKQGRREDGVKQTNQKLGRPPFGPECSGGESRSVKSEFDRVLTMIGQEMRDPLAVIGLSAELISRAEAGSVEVAEWGQSICRQSLYLRRLIDERLYISRPPQLKLAPGAASTPFSRIFSESVGSILILASQKRIELTSDPGNCSLIVEGDPVPLQRYLVELLAQVVKATPERGLVRVSIQEEEEAVVLRFRHSGEGIPAETLGRLAQRKSPTAPDHGPTKIWLDRECGHETADREKVRCRTDERIGNAGFDLRISKRQAFETYVPRSIKRPTFGDSWKIAVIEDHPDIRRMLQLMLQREGYEVFVASDGETGLSLIEKMRPEIALVDIDLPRLNGCDIARKIRIEPTVSDTILAALTAYGPGCEHDMIMASGFDEHFVKPVAPGKLIEFVSDRLGRC